MMKLEITGKISGTVLYSDCDHNLILQHKWRINAQGYAVNENGDRMHRLIMKPPKDQEVDHIEHDKLDNRREKLRVVQPILNRQNQKKRSGTISKYIGVTRKRQKWISSVNVDKKTFRFGPFDSEKKAAMARDLFIFKNKHSHQLNFSIAELESEIKKDAIIGTANEKRSKFRGATYKRKGDFFEANITVNEKKKYLGSSKNREDCYRLYDKAVVSNGLPENLLNYPHEYPDYKCQKIDKLKGTKNVDSSVSFFPSNSKLLVTVDEDIYEDIKSFSCSLNKGGYPMIQGKLLSRIIMKPKDPSIFIDHINRNKLDNRKINLRPSDASKNSRNATKRDNTSSKYVGVSMNSETKMWSAGITFERKRTHIGSFDDEITAARAHDIYVIKEHPDDHYPLNFQWTDDEIKKYEIIFADTLDKIKNNKNKTKNKYRGVCGCFKHWEPQIHSGGSTISLGIYKQDDVAARVRDLYHILRKDTDEKKKRRIKLNFTWTDDDINIWKEILKDTKLFTELNKLHSKD